MARACPSCGNNEINTDEKSGTTYCERCGTVVEENAIVSEVVFGETSTGAAVVQGSFVAADQTHVKSLGPGKHHTVESREQTLANGRRRISALAIALGLPERLTVAATRWFTLAVSHNFVQGRRSQYVVASCLYIVCRQELTSHQLIDFSDVLQVNVFILGSTFLKLVRCLSLKLPIVDPSLYISRFAAMLEFGHETQRVASDAVRLVQRMDRDWIQQGRRPSGICGACLLIAARMNNFRRTIAEIVHVVKVADMTVLKRLQEFKSTDSSDLTVEQFRNIWIEHGGNPPSYDQTRVRKRPKTQEEEEEEEEEDDDERIETPINPSLLEAAASAHAAIEEDEAEAMQGAAALKTQKITTHPPTQEGALVVPMKAAVDVPQDGVEETLSDLDDEELDAFILDDTAANVKTKVWMEFNHDYLAAQEQKRLKADADGKVLKKEPHKRKKRAPPRDSHTADLPDTPAESAKQMFKQRNFSKKLNYAVLDHLFDS